jgi:hypothetical protein
LARQEQKVVAILATNNETVMVAEVPPIPHMIEQCPLVKSLQL